MVSQSLMDALEWAVNATFWTSLFFPIVIAGVWPWWQDWFGQTMVALDLCVAGAAAQGVLRYDFGIRSTSLAWADVVFLVLVTAVIVWRTIMIFRTQRKGKTQIKG